MAEQITGDSKIAIINKIQEVKSKKLQAEYHPLEADALWRFCQYVLPEFFVEGKIPVKKACSDIQKALCYAMGYDGYDDYAKIMMTLHPRFGKSLVTTLACVMGLGYNNSRSIMRNTSTSDLAEKFSRDARNFIQLEYEKEQNFTQKGLEGKQLINKKIHDLFPDMQLSTDKRALSSWALKTAYDLSYLCAGVGATIVGKGCDLLGIIDDPYKGVKDAMNSKVTDDLMSWYEGEHRRRFDLNKNVAEIIIMQRWHDDDFCARLLQTDSEINLIEFDVEKPLNLRDDDFEKVESYCESVISTKRLRQIKKGMYSNGEGNLYQAEYRSKTKSGSKSMFATEDLKRYSLAELEDIKTKANYKVGVLDFADEGSDFLCSLVGLLHDNHWYILPSLIFTKESTDTTRGLVANQILMETPVKHTFEANSGGKGFAEQVDEIVKPYGLVGTVAYERNDSNKHTRILTYEGYIKERFVFLQESEIKTNSDYWWFMYHLTKYKRDATYKKDDAPDALAQLAKQVKVNYGCSFGRF